jgi:autotransporter-associated beta strand protein
VDVFLQNDDAFGASSFDSVGNWSPAIEPSGGLNDYFTGSNRLRTPDGAATADFQGNSLTVQSGGSLALKAADGGSVNVDDLIIEDGGEIVVFSPSSTMTLTGSITLTGVATLDGRDTGRVLAIDSDISGAGGLSITTSGAGGTGEVRLGGANNTYTGDTVVTSSGLLTQGAASAFSAASAMTVNGTVQLNGFDGTVASLSGGGVVQNEDADDGANTLTINPGTSAEFSGELRDGDGLGADGTLAVGKTGAGTQIISGTNTYTGGTTVEQGILDAAGDTALGSGSVTVTNNAAGGGTLEVSGATLANEMTLVGRTSTTAHIQADGTPNELQGDIGLQGSGNFVISAGDGEDTLTLSGAISDDAGTGDDNLVLQGGNTTEGTASGGITMDGTGTDTITKAGVGKWTIDSSISGVDGVSVEDGTLVLDGEGNTFAVGADPVTDISIDIAGGTLAQTGAQAIDSSQQAGGINIDAGGTLDMGGLDASVNFLTGAGTVTSSVSVDPTLTLGNNSGVDATYSGAITDGGDGAEIDIVKAGGNTQTLSGNLTLDTDAGNGETGDVTVNDGKLILSGSNTFGQATVSAGVLSAQSDTALGGTAFGTDVTGTGQLEVEGGVTLNEVISLFGRADESVHLENVADSNSISGSVGSVELEDNGAGTQNFTIVTTDGALTIANVVQSGLADGDDAFLRLGGNSDFDDNGSSVINALTMTSADTNNLTKFGTGTWDVNDASISNGTISSQGGVLNLTGTASLTGDLVYEVLNGAELDVTGIGGLTADAGDRVKGTGLIDGDIVAATGAEITAADFGTVGELEVSGLLDLNGTLQVDVSGAMIDKIIVAGAFDITEATLDIVGSLTQSIYVFAMYGSLTGAAFASINPDPLVGYTINYAYQGNQIALLRDTPPPVPVPAPLALIAIGALGLAATRRGRMTLAA